MTLDATDATDATQTPFLHFLLEKIKKIYKSIAMAITLVPEKNKMSRMRC